VEKWVGSPASVERAGSDRLLVRYRPWGRVGSVLGGLMAGSVMVLSFGAPFLLAGAGLMWLGGGPPLEGRSWGMVIAEFGLSWMIPAGLAHGAVGLLMRRHDRTRWANPGSGPPRPVTGLREVLVPPLLEIVLGAGGIILCREQSLLSLRSWLEAGAVALAWGCLTVGVMGLAFAVFAGLIVAVSPASIQLNRQYGRWWVMGPSDFPQGCPFDETLAVQVLSVGPPAGWQVNVACKGADRPRLRLGEYGERDTALSVARAVADFVGVPLVEQTAPAA
jgi:hypothetical protein